MNLIQIIGIIFGFLAIGIWICVGILGYNVLILQDKISDKLEALWLKEAEDE